MRNHSSRYRSSYAPYVGSHVPPLTVVFCGLSYSASCLSFPFHIFPDHISVMKRMRTFALPALALISVCMLLGRDYITHYLQLSTGRKGREIYAVLNNATSGQALKVLPLTANRAVENQTSEDDRLEAQKTPTSPAAATTAQLQYTPAVEFRSLVGTASRLPDPSKLISYKDGDPKLLHEAPRYLQAIMDPSDISFPGSHVQHQPTIDMATSNRPRRPPHQNPNTSLRWTYTLAPHSFRAFSAASLKQFASSGPLTVPSQSSRVGPTTAHTRSYTRSPLNLPP